MAITSAAKKAFRKSLKRAAENRVYKNKLRSLLKEAKSLVAQKKAKEAKNLLPQIYKALDKAAKVNVIKKNTASRLKSRTTKLIAKSQ